MAWTPLLLVLLSLHRKARPVLTQPASLSGSPGASARLSCTLSSGYSVGDFSLSWFQQKPGSPPWYVVRVKSSGVPDRFSGSKSGSSASLTTSVHAEDDADYCCFSWADGLEVCTVLQARAKGDKGLHPPQPRGAPGKASAPPFLEALRPWNPAE
uniref:Uncharacterized protein n=1 Tax=Ovis aries TaxID=9940 RepID=A0AC11CZN6_SHEEP